MSKSSKITPPLLIAAAALASGDVSAHAGFLGNPDGSAVNYIEGKTAYLQMNIGHDCSDGDQHYPVQEVVVMLPQGHSLTRIEKPSGATVKPIENGMHWAVGATSSLPRQNATFRKSMARLGVTHPDSVNGPRALVWKNGKLTGDHYEGFEFKVALPKFPATACADKAVLYFPSVQYCAKGKAEAWVLAPTGIFPASTLGDANGASASITMVRDTAANPLPADCANPETYYIYPDSGADGIDKFMTR